MTCPFQEQNLTDDKWRVAVKYLKTGLEYQVCIVVGARSAEEALACVYWRGFVIFSDAFELSAVKVEILAAGA